MKPKGYTRNFIALNKAADPLHVGVQLGRICIEKDIPVQDVADYLNVSRQVVYYWFIGRTHPQPANRKAMWELLDRLAAKTNS